MNNCVLLAVKLSNTDFGTHTPKTENRRGPDVYFQPPYHEVYRELLALLTPLFTIGMITRDD